MTSALRYHPSALKKIERHHVEEAMREFDRIGVEEMIKKYECGKSSRWCIHHNGRHYDQKLILRAAHGNIPGEMPLPTGPGTFTSDHACHHLKQLGFPVVECPDKKSS